MKINIKKPDLKQINEITELWRDQYDFHHNLDSIYYVKYSLKLNEKFRDLIEKAITNNDPHILIAEIGSEVVGFITFKEEENSYIDSNIKHFGVIIELFVDEKYRNMGIGTKLMENAEKYFKDMGLKFIEIQLSTFNSNALSFYEDKKYMNRQTFVFKKI